MSHRHAGVSLCCLFGPSGVVEALAQGLMTVLGVPQQAPCTCPRRADIDTQDNLFPGTEQCYVRLTGPYFYLPKMESHLEARLWNDIFCEAQDMLNIPRGTIKVSKCGFWLTNLDPCQCVLLVVLAGSIQPVRSQYSPLLMILCSPPASLKRCWQPSDVFI